MGKSLLGADDRSGLDRTHLRHGMPGYLPGIPLDFYEGGGLRLVRCRVVYRDTGYDYWDAYDGGGGGAWVVYADGGDAYYSTAATTARVLR